MQSRNTTKTCEFYLIINDVSINLIGLIVAGFRKKRILVVESNFLEILEITLNSSPLFSNVFRSG